jgi:hypothetical protein
MKIIRYTTLKECFLKMIGKEDISDGEIESHYWVGHDGKRGFRLKIDKWLRSDPKVWGWADYQKKTIHVFVDPGADIFEVITLLSHEIGHFQRPRYPFGHDEERKAEQYRKVTQTAINLAKEIMG